MSTDLTPFAYVDGAELRSFLVDGEPWFVAADVARLLEYSATSAMTRRLDDEDKGVRDLHTPGGIQQMAIISEAGFYAAILGSQSAQAKAVKRWLTHDVLPSLRRTGSYSTTPVHAIPSTYGEALRAAAAEFDRAESERAGRLEAERHAAELHAPASAWSHLAESTGDYSVADAAKVLSRDPQINIGRGRLFSFMAAEGWIFREQGTNSWKAYQTQVNTGRLTEKVSGPYLNERTGEMVLPAPTIRITAKGMAELHRRLGGGDQLAILAATS
jgi:prophage antirepressor-like protein